MILTVHFYLVLSLRMCKVVLSTLISSLCDACREKFSSLISVRIDEIEETDSEVAVWKHK